MDTLMDTLTDPQDVDMETKTGTISPLSPSPLDPSSPPREYLWGITFLNPHGTEEDRTRLRHYSTWYIDSDGFWCGSQIPEYHRLYSKYKLIDEFSDIASQLISINFWDKFYDLWYSALSAALWKIGEEEERESFYDRLVSMYHLSTLEIREAE